MGGKDERELQDALNSLAAALRDEAIRVIAANRSGSRPTGTERLARVGLQTCRLALDLWRFGGASIAGIENLVAAAASFAGEYLLDDNVQEAEELLGKAVATGDASLQFHILRILAENSYSRTSALIAMTALNLDADLLDRRDKYLLCVLGHPDELQGGPECAIALAEHLKCHEVQFASSQARDEALRLAAIRSP